MPERKPIEDETECAEDDDFAEAIWCILATDYYHYPAQSDQVTLNGLISRIRSRYHLDVILQIFRSSPTGDETEVIGRALSQGSNNTMVFWASDASGISDVLPADAGENFPALISRYLRLNGWNLCQFSGTEIMNLRPEVLSRDEVTQIINKLILDSNNSWAETCSDIKTTDEFVSKYYSE